MPTMKSWQQQSAEEPDWSRPMVSRGFAGQSQASDEQALALRYRQGQVQYFFKAYANALDVWRPLAQQNYAPAQASLGWLYQLGLGVPKDFLLARQWYLQAVKQSHPIAQNNLATMLENGLGVDRDEPKALKLYGQSAQSGYRFAQFNFGRLLMRQAINEEQKEIAWSWIQKAARQDVDAAKRYIAEHRATR
ncbi:MAG: sel1 repeat family protein [Gammaproteobacteria bacterium]|nr:sel1 repeat family protein [Gammaproteobacteria bacterium]MDH5731106.1 sel1 repeat family protein [Gammaproteobacteria bacterium]